MGTAATTTGEQQGDARQRSIHRRGRPAPSRAEAPAWGYLARPSLMPTVYAPSVEGTPREAGAEVAVRRV